MIEAIRDKLPVGAG